MADNAFVEDDALGKQRTIGQYASADDRSAKLDVGPHQTFDNANCLEFEFWRSWGEKEKHTIGTRPVGQCHSDDAGDTNTNIG